MFDLSNCRPQFKYLIQTFLVLVWYPCTLQGSFYFKLVILSSKGCTQILLQFELKFQDKLFSFTLKSAILSNFSCLIKIQIIQISFQTLLLDEVCSSYYNSYIGQKFVVHQIFKLEALKYGYLIMVCFLRTYLNSNLSELDLNLFNQFGSPLTSSTFLYLFQPTFLLKFSIWIIFTLNIIIF